MSASFSRQLPGRPTIRRPAAGVRFTGACLLAVACVWQPTVGAAAAPLPPDAIQRSIERASEWLIRQQQRDGSWQAMRSDDTRVGATGLAVLA